MNDRAKLAVVALLLFTFPADAHTSRYAEGVQRNHHGRIARSHSAVHRFEKQTGHPHGWKGHVVDHVIPLCKRGADRPSNMQWQTKARAKAKDRWECRK